MSDEAVERPPAARPLAGITVVALEQAVAAPLASARLADAGARVIKIERPGGDFARGYDVAANGMSSYFAWLNRGKESIVLDLAASADRAVMDALVQRCDVFIQNLSVGSADRLGYGADRLLDRDPAKVVCEISGYGQSVPMAHAKAYDLLVQAESGLLTESGPPGPLGRVGVSVVDIGTGLNAASGIVTALFQRERTGEGAHLQVSLFDSIAEWMCVPLLHYDYLDQAPQRVGLAHPSIAPYGGFELADGSTVVISVQSDREWRDFCRAVIDRPDLADHADFAHNIDRVNNREKTDREVRRSLRKLDAGTMIDKLREHRVAHARVNDVAGLSTHPHLRRMTVDHDAGIAAIPAPPVVAKWFDEGTHHHVPALDEHGLALRSEFAS